MSTASVDKPTAAKTARVGLWFKNPNFWLFVLGVAGAIFLVGLAVFALVISGAFFS